MTLDDVLKKLAEMAAPETGKAGPTEKAAAGYFEELGRQVEEGTLSKEDLQKAIKQWQESGMSSFGQQYQDNPEASRKAAARHTGMFSEKAKMKKLLGEDYEDAPPVELDNV